MRLKFFKFILLTIRLEVNKMCETIARRYVYWRRLSMAAIVLQETSL